MICLGSPQAAPTHLEAEAAQRRVLELFRADFVKRFPDGIVISELEYMGRTTAAPNEPGPLQFPGSPTLSRVMEALTKDFRNWSKDRDYRKCDALGLAPGARVGELIEVTTGDNALSAITQIQVKLAILRETVERIHELSFDWRPSPWRPSPDQQFYALPSRQPGEVRYLCYFPTVRLAAPPGVILYEVHVITRPTVPVPVPVPSDVADKLRQAYRDLKARQIQTEAWARQFLTEHPVVGVALRGLAVVVGVALLVAAIILIFDPVPGDEAVAAGAAMMLLRLSIS
jgi:hypothetical protein